ncbi:type VI secretion system baseplate subunit TssE [Parasulfuritortus cantonensis]|uniref:Type VI secretion system baseplate subunit TssE n=1 Tax=Parasulfuritortus cantonensis TaxID=2528202 RepID=A0A4R1BRI9_9PROT|nr:type VI secretion system baseplate subunit TssE [Parasulfuritortus cantonensis]TCJ20399.1 type VI secretion system baseplate subunit TssE [Parasulfuritortus cantonensis]
MAEPVAKERLNPSLLDRLIDNEPDKRSEARDARSFSTARLRESVLRDLNWLFNATQYDDAALEDYPQVRRSVVNYGIPALSGRPAAALNLREVEQMLRRSIIDFEPRLLADTVRVRAQANDEGFARHNVISFRIEAQMWAQPYPIDLLLRTELDMESGESRVVEAKRE